MAKMKEVTSKDYKLKAGDIVVFAMTYENIISKDISFKCPKEGANIAIFNLRKSYKRKLNKQIKKEKICGRLYIDDEYNLDVEYIINKCHEVYPRAVFIDFDDEVNYSKADFKKLKKLCKELELILTITPNVITTDVIPNISDIKNKALKDVADVIVIVTDDTSVIAKNKHGKTGVFKDEGECDNE